MNLLKKQKYENTNQQFSIYAPDTRVEYHDKANECFDRIFVVFKNITTSTAKGSYEYIKLLSYVI